ncbi:PREDICTED: uncharacterized protein LOC108369640 isoform X1 [Rhagoletis zephyria]|uniref:uncharacterized protein LOC108369640 isoform X1 n=1 Tax=Rhagoletis zephyria TaxID=28612 RepID=UPI0008115BCB|nr:PREDICTED: uncharacterized protein LOC108369640 isoform X1 [Rhagoletis zephyria]
MTKLEKQKEIVSITHFINPHLFWFHKIDACNDDYRSILEIERELAEYYNDHQAWTKAQRRPPINAMVAVKFLAWNKMIRARVDHIAGFGKNVAGGEFVMWAIDYGFPFQTKTDQIYRLPEKLTTPINYVRCGGLLNVLPAENFFMKNMMVKTISNKWDQRACELVEKAINDSESIMFIKEYSLNGQEWGELVIKTNMGVKYRVNDHLISLHLAADAGPNFREECLKLKTNKIFPWMCNNGSSKFHTNRAYLYPAVVGITHTEIKCPKLECDNAAKQKVEEWYERNQCSSGHEAGLLDTTTEYTMTEGSVIDAVSIRKYDQLLEADLTKIEEHEENQHMQLAGVLSKSRVEKFVEGNEREPPLPDNLDFDMKAGNTRSNQTIETTDSEISAIKYIHLDDSTANTTDVFHSKKTSRDNKKYSPTNVNPWTATTSTKSISDEGKYDPENKSTTKITENLQKFDEISVVQEDIGSFAEYLITLRNQYLERKSGKQVINENTNVLPREAKQSKDGINLKFTTLTKSKRSGKRESKDLNTTFHGLRMIPAGYDFMNLHDYNDQDHWHCKKSTINDRVPHNEIDLQDFGNRTFS